MDVLLDYFKDPFRGYPEQFTMTRPASAFARGSSGIRTGVRGSAGVRTVSQPSRPTPTPTPTSSSQPSGYESHHRGKRDRSHDHDYNHEYDGGYYDGGYDEPPVVITEPSSITVPQPSLPEPSTTQKISSKINEWAFPISSACIACAVLIMLLAFFATM